MNKKSQQLNDYATNMLKTLPIKPFHQYNLNPSMLLNNDEKF